MVKNLRIIIALFALLTILIGLVFHFYTVDSVYNIKTDIAVMIIGMFCMSLFGVSFFKAMRKRPFLLSYLFKISVTLWFIAITAMNHFPADYSYCMILVVMIFGLVYSDSKSFMIFFFSTFIVLSALAFFAIQPIIQLGPFLLIYLSTGIITYLILRSKDKTEDDFRRAQINAQAVFYNSVGFLFFLDKKFNIISYNKLAEDIFAQFMKIELKVGASIFNYFPPDTHEHFLTTLNKCLQGEVITNEKQVKFPNGMLVWVENTFNPVYDDQKKLLGLTFQTVRIDERKQIEEALRESEMRFAQIVENIEDGIWIGTADQFLYMNDSFAKIWGRTKEELINNPSLLGASIHPDDISELEKNKKLIIEKNTLFSSLDSHYRIIRPDGEVRWIWARRFPVTDAHGKPYRIVGINADITEKKDIEARLTQQNEFLQTLIDTIPNPIFYKDDKGIYIGCNKAFEQNIGGKREDLIGKSVFDLSPKELAEIYYKKDQELLENPGFQIYETQVKYLDGSIRDVIFHKAAFYKNDGSVGGLVGVILDITERKKIEQALQLSEKKFKEITDTLPLLIYEADESGNVIYFNKAGYTYTGYSDEDFEKGLNLAMMFPPGEMERAMVNARKTMSGNFLGSLEYTMQRKDGSQYPVLINTIPVIHDSKVVGRRGVVTDITEIKKAEEKILASLKEKEVLLREIHHRIKNNLQVISSMLRLQSDSLSDQKTIDVFREAQSRVLTMSLVHEKLYKANNFSEINAAEYINELVPTISKSYIHHKNIKIDIHAEDASINLDTMIPLGLILNELVTNCLKHAFPDRNDGLIEISFRKEKDKKYALCIHDNGIGIMNDLDIENVKTLGLRLVKTLVNQIGGELIIKNHSGSSFTILFGEMKIT